MRNIKNNTESIIRSITERKEQKRIVELSILAVSVELFVLSNMNYQYTEEIAREKLRIEPIAIQTCSEMYRTRYDEVKTSLIEEDVELVALLVDCEAGNQDELGKRYVADVVWNRVEDERFPDNVYDVIYQKDPVQFATAERLHDGKVDKEIYRLVLEEFDNRTNNEMLYFCNYDYISDIPLFKHGDHYFSK